MNMNLQNFEDRWEQRLKGMAELVKQVKPHLFAVQRLRIQAKPGEQELNHLKMLRSLLPDYQAEYFRAMNYPTEYTEEGQALFSILPLTKKPGHFLSFKAGDEDRNRRGLLCAQVDVSSLLNERSGADTKVDIYVASTTYADNIAMRHAKEIWTHIQTASQGQPYVALGNFNIQGSGLRHPVWRYLIGQEAQHKRRRRRKLLAERGEACMRDAYAELHDLSLPAAMTYSPKFPTSRTDLVLYGNPAVRPEGRTQLLHLSASSFQLTPHLASPAQHGAAASGCPAPGAPMQNPRQLALPRSRQLSDHSIVNVEFRLSLNSSWEAPSECKRLNQQMLRRQKSEDRPHRTSKFLIVGSAPVSLEWWPRHKGYFMARDWNIVALNNAWSIVFPDVGEWFHASDYAILGTLYPEPHQWPCIKKRTVTSCMTKMYNKAMTCIALLDALYMILQRHRAEVAAGVRDTQLEVVLLGLDMEYSNSGTHFYTAKGTLDPLRRGKTWLLEELNHAQRTFATHGATLQVAGPERPTLLPYPWFNDHLQ